MLKFQRLRLNMTIMVR